jgi:serine/threonine protein kinase
VSEGGISLATGEVLDDTFEIGALLGEGGMGQVYEGKDLNLRRRVAIKVAWPHVAPGLLRREAQALAQIRHPSAIAVYALSEWRGVEYLVMERIFGLSLEQHIERIRAAGQPFTSEEALDVLIGIVDGLTAIHRAGLTHRDVKPSNVMLAPGNRVVLMDFGLVLADVNARDAGAGPISGSPAYMAPESIRSSIHPGSVHLVDLYAVGVIAFEMLTGQMPFEAATVGDLLRAHLLHDAPRVDELRPDTPDALSALVARLLAKDRAERPESAESLLAELRAIRGRGEISAPIESPFTILIADDDELMRDILKGVLAQAIPDAQITLAASGAAAIERVRSAPPDLLVLDLQMPEINGVEVCMFLRGTHLAERCRIILVSADADENDVTLLRQLGVSHYLPKSETLLERLGALSRQIRESTR